MAPALAPAPAPALAPPPRCTPSAGVKESNCPPHPQRPSPHLRTPP